MRLSPRDSASQEEEKREPGSSKPVFYNEECKDKNRMFAEDIKGAQPFDLFEPVYSLQFEEEGTYYIEGGAKVDSISPNHMYHPLRKEEFYNKSKYRAFLMDGEDDPRRNKPKMIYPMPKCMSLWFQQYKK